MPKRRKPNLFVIGAMKSGTTSLHMYLDSHPSIFMSNPKETDYFIDQPKSRRNSYLENNYLYKQDENEYLSLFDCAEEVIILGESSTNYSKLPIFSSVSQRIFDFNSDSRFIYIIRDPLDRTISHYWHAVRVESEKREMFEAFQKSPHYRAVSHYAMQLIPYLELFGQSRVRIITLEQMKLSPVHTMQSVYGWLGVDDLFVPTNIRQRYGSTPREIQKIRGLGLLQQFRHSRSWAEIGRYFPHFLRTIGRNFSERDIDVASISIKKVIDYLRPIQQSETQELSKLLDRQFPEWTTLYGCEPD